MAVFIVLSCAPASAGDSCLHGHFSDDGDYICETENTRAIDAKDLGGNSATPDQPEEENSVTPLTGTPQNCQKMITHATTSEVPVICENNGPVAGCRDGEEITGPDGKKMMKAVTTKVTRCADETETAEDEREKIDRLEKELEETQARLEQLLEMTDPMSQDSLMHELQHMSIPQQEAMANAMNNAFGSGGGGSTSGFGSQNPLQQMLGGLGRQVQSQVAGDNARDGFFSPEAATPGATTQGQDGNGGHATGQKGGEGYYCNVNERKPMSEQAPDFSKLDAQAKYGRDLSHLDIENSTTDAVLGILISREGWYNKWYKDSLGKPTIGVGHLIVGGDPYPPGTVLSNQQVADLLKKDIQTKWNGAMKQMKDLGINDHCFFVYLMSVNLQLGQNWPSGINSAGKAGGRPTMPKIYAAMKAGDFAGAANWVGNTGWWWSQTPKRAADFRKILNAMAATAK